MHHLLLLSFYFLSFDSPIFPFSINVHSFPINFRPCQEHLLQFSDPLDLFWLDSKMAQAWIQFKLELFFYLYNSAKPFYSICAKFRRSKNIFFWNILSLTLSLFIFSSLYLFFKENQRGVRESSRPILLLRPSRRPPHWDSRASPPRPPAARPVDLPRRPIGPADPHQF